MRKPPAPKAASAKKVKKRNPWSDDESKSESDLEENEPVIPRETKSQRASGTAASALQEEMSHQIPHFKTCTHSFHYTKLL